jgi:hypothetical protein
VSEQINPTEDQRRVMVHELACRAGYLMEEVVVHDLTSGDEVLDAYGELAPYVELIAALQTDGPVAVSELLRKAVFDALDGTRQRIRCEQECLNRLRAGIWEYPGAGDEQERAYVEESMRRLLFADLDAAGELQGILDQIEDAVAVTA